MHACTRRLALRLTCWMLMLGGAATAAQEQLVDPAFKSVVSSPAYTHSGPTVAIDEAHANFHRASGQYRPFADLLRSDGYVVKSFADPFEPRAFAGIDVLVIANALPQNASRSGPAFSDEECAALRDWIRGGGALLLIADHAPFGAAAENLARGFGVEMGKGWTFDRAETGELTTQLTFSRADGSLGTHAISRGRGSEEQVRVVRSFTGQSLSVPDGATVLMALSATSREAATPDDLNAEDAAARKVEGAKPLGTHSQSVANRAQGLAMRFGKGRIVVLGEAGLLSAQLIRFPDGREVRFGMNVPGTDNQQFGLNVLHWLSGLLP